MTTFIFSFSLSFFANCLLVFLPTVNSTTNFPYRAIYSESLSTTPCNQRAGTPDATSPSLVQGNKVFTDAGLASASIQELMVTMWVFPQGGLNTGKDYTIFSLHDEQLPSTTPPTVTDIFALKYNLGTSTVSGTLKNVPLTSSMTSLMRGWQFINVVIRLDATIANTDQVRIWTSGGWKTPIEPKTSPGVSTKSFNRSTLLFNFGHSSSLLLPTHFPSCAKVRNVVVYLQVDPLDWLDNTRFAQTQAFAPRLLFHYDVTDSFNKRDVYMSPTKYQSQLKRVPIDVLTNVFVQRNKQLKLTTTVSSDSNGCMLYFEFKSKWPTDSNLNIVTISLNPNFQLTIYYENYNQLMVKSSNAAADFLVITVIPEWYQLAVKIINEEGQLRSSVFVRRVTSLYESKFYFPTGLRAEVTIEFGDTNSSTQLEIDNVAVYQGTQESETSTCYIQVEGVQSTHCLICRYPWELSYPTGRTCVSYSGSTNKYAIEDWSRPRCPIGQVYYVSSSTCECSYPFYKSGSSCVKCPSYCRGCSTATTCLESDPNRDSNGKCLNNLFDDGYSCIKRTFSIPQRSNYHFRFSNSWLSDSMNLPGAQLLLSNSSDSFYFAFSMNDFSSSASTASFPQMLLRIQESSTLEKVRITVESNTINSTYSVCFWYLSSTQLNCFLITPSTVTWIGMWINSIEVILAVQSNGRSEVSRVALASPLLLASPSLCFGTCASLPSGIYPFSLNLSSCEFKFFRGMTKPDDFMGDFLNFLQERTQVIAHYLFKKVGQFPWTFDNQVEKSQIGNVQLEVQGKMIDLLLGLKSEYGVFGSIKGSILTSRELSISMNLSINWMDEEIKFFSYETGAGDLIEYTFIPMFAQEVAIIRVSYSDETLESKSCTVPFQQNRFLALIPRFINTGDSSGIFFFEIEIVSEYCRETLKFYFPRNPLSASAKQKKNVKLLDGGKRDIMMNNLRFFDGSDFYFDYTAIDPCFMYYDTSDMKCLKAKEGFSLFQGKPIDPKDCSTQISDSILIYNKETMECQDSFIDYPLCKIISEVDLATCLKCRDVHADSSIHCQCIDGYFLSQNGRTCEVCHEKCSKCSGTADNCTECKFENTILPSCSCKEQNQFQDTDYSCQDCSAQCLSCETKSDNCTICASDRVNEPTCDCDRQYFDLTLSTQLICIPYECSYKCETCEFSSTTCTSCSENRENAPYCDCLPNYFEKNKTCIQCASHYYYDKSRKECLPCSSECVECQNSNSNCTACEPALFLFQGTCLCSDLSSFFLSESGEISCADGMDVSLRAMQIESKNCLIFTFDYALEDIDFNIHPIDKLVFVYFKQVSQSDYSIVSSRIDTNQLILELKFHKSLSIEGGLAIFLTSNVFRNQKEEKVLRKKYEFDYLSFQMGPIAIKDELYSQDDSVASATAFLKDSANQNVMNVIKQLQIVFYLINTLQPCSIFLLVDARVPPNFYAFLSIFGLLVFPSVSEFGIDNSTQQEFSFFGDRLEFGKDVSLNQSRMFKNVGMSGSMIVSMPITIIQLLFWPCLFCLIVLVKQFIEIQKVSMESSRSLAEKSDSVKRFVIARMNAGYEGAMLLLIALSCNQFKNVNESQFYNRLSVYTAVLLIGVLLIRMTRNYLALMEVQKCMNEMRNNGGMIKFEKEGISQNNQVAMRVMEKLKGQNQSSVVYLYLQSAKKVFMAMVVVLLDDFPQLSCILCASILVCSLVISGYLRPYKHALSNFCKIFGEIAQAIVWSCYIFVFIPYGENISRNQTMSDEDTQFFIKTGQVCMIALLLFNLLYFLEFIYLNVVLKIKGILDARRMKRVA